MGIASDRPLPVEMTAPVGMSSPPRFSFDVISYEPSFQRLTIYFGNDADADNQLAVDYAANILELLPHTPITGLGINFSFSANRLPDAMDTLMPISEPIARQLGEDATVFNRTWANSFIWGQSLANVQTQWDGNEAMLDMNFHYEVHSAAQAVERLRVAECFVLHKNMALSIAALMGGE